MKKKRQWIARAFLVGLMSGMASSTLVALPDVPATYKPVIVNPASELFQREVLLDNLESPWAMDFLPDGSLLITEHGGKVWHYKKKTGKQLAADLSHKVAYGEPQLGLLDVGVKTIGKINFVYLSYTATRQENNENYYTTCLLRRQWMVNMLVPREEKTFCVTPWGKETSQFGGALAFDKNGTVFLSAGDRGVRDSAQNPTSLWGKILALRDSRDNLFQDTFNGREGKAIWSSGHRNPQGLYYDTPSRRLYASEHGPEGGDEINLIEQGKNYGWPTITYGHEYQTHAPIGEGTTKPGMEQPLYYYAPSIATSGMMIYHGKLFPEWENHIFVGALAGQHLNHLIVENGIVIGEERWLRDFHSRVRDVKTAKDGSIFVLLEKGILLRLARKDTAD